MRNTIETLKAHPYALFLICFAGTIAFGLFRLLGLLQANGLGA